MRTGRNPARDKEKEREVDKVTTLDSFLALQMRENDPVTRPQNTRTTQELLTSQSSQTISLSTGGADRRGESLSAQTPRRKFGSQTLPRNPENTDQLIDEITHLQHALVDKFRSNQKLVSGSQFRSGMKDPLKCDQCDAKDTLLKKTKENVRSLKFQISRLEDRLYNGQKKGEKFDFNLSGQSLEAQNDVDELKRSNAELRQQLLDLEQANSLFNQHLTREKQTADTNLESAMKLLKERDEVIRVLREDISLLETSNANSVEEADHRVTLVKNQLNLKIEYTNDLEEKYVKASGELEQLRSLSERVNNAENLQDEVAKLKKELAEMEMELRVHSRKQEDLRQTILRLEGEGKDRASEFSEANQQATLYKNLLDLANKEINGLRQDISTRDNQRKKSAGEVDILRSRLLETEAQLVQLQSERSHSKEELESNILKMNTMVKRLTAESEKSAQAVQKAISSSVRLCVVAPTVNVHVADKKMKFRTNVPREALSEFLESQILSKYTFLFEQKTESVGPDGVTDIQPWIKRILGEMQASIEEHISAAMRSNSS